MATLSFRLIRWIPPCVIVPLLHLVYYYNSQRKFVHTFIVCVCVKEGNGCGRGRLDVDVDVNVPQGQMNDVLLIPLELG